MSHERRASFVRLQQELARRALARGDLEGARSVLRALQPTDFDGAAVISEVCLRVVRDDEAHQIDLRSAATILGRLPVGGSRGGGPS